jgi:hypothetical protein
VTILIPFDNRRKRRRHCRREKPDGIEREALGIQSGDPEFKILEKKGIISVQWLHQSAAADL